MDPNATVESNPTREEIATLAYEIYEQEGRPEGRSLDHWFQAELLLRSGAKSPAGRETQA